MFAAAQLLGCFERCPRVFGEIAEECERVQSSGGEEMWFVDGMLPSAGKVACGWPYGSKSEHGVW